MKIRFRGVGLASFALGLASIVVVMPVVAPLGVNPVTIAAGFTPSASSPDPIVISVGAAPGYSVTTISATAGQNVSIELLATDNTFHTFTLSPVVNFQLPSTDTPVDVYTFFHQHTPLVNISVPPVAGSSAWANFTAPGTAGTYEYLCENPGHFQVGMHGNLTVSAKASNTGFIGILAALIGVLIIVILVLIAIAIAAAVLIRRKRRRAPLPQPSERPVSEPPKAGP